MPNPGEFDPAKAIQGVRQQQAAEEAKKRAAEEAEKQQRNLYRANILELLHHADKELETIRNLVVSEFVVTHRWYTPTSKTVSNPVSAGSTTTGSTDWSKLRPKLRPNEVIISGSGEKVSLFRPRIEYKVATRHERQTRYCGSWLSLSCTHGRVSARSGLMKLRQPRAGYAYVAMIGYDPRGVVGNITTNLTDPQGREQASRFRPVFLIYESLEEGWFISGR